MGRENLVRVGCVMSDRIMGPAVALKLSNGSGDT